MVLPSGASAFNVSGFSYSPSTLQANGHPTTTIAFSRQGSENEDLRDIQLDLPPGVFANPEAALPKCSASQFNADSCPAGSEVGNSTISVKALSLLDLDIPASIDVLAPDPGSTATLGISARPSKICIVLVFCAQPNKIFLKTQIQIDTFDGSELRTYTPGSPKSAVIGIPLLFVTPTITGDITINRLSLTFNSRAGTGARSCNWWGTCTTKPPTGPYFFRNPSGCDLATAKVNLVSHQGAQSAATASFTPTGCSSVPSTSTSFTFTPQIKSYQTPSPVTFAISIPEADATIQHALPKVVDANFPVGSGINFSALADVTTCSETALRAKACPSSSIIGNAQALSKYIPEGLTGPVYAAGVGGSVGNQVPIAVLLRGPRETYVVFRGTLGIRGSVEGGDGRAYARFDRVPQLPFSNFALNLTKSLYVNPDTCGSKQTSTAFTQFSGQVVNKTSSYTNTGCPVAPDTTITNFPATPTVDPTADFAYTSTAPDASFQCRLTKQGDAPGAYFPCDGGSYTTEPLPNGTYTFDAYSVNGTVADPTPDSKTFTLNLSSVFTIDPSISPTTVPAASHVDMQATVDIDGGQPASVNLAFPRGFNASLNATGICSVGDAYSGTCPADSLIGDVALTVNTGPFGTVTGNGELFITEAPTPDDAGGAAVKVVYPFGTFIAVAGAYLTNNGNNQTIALRDFPTAVYDDNFVFTDITIKKIVANFYGAANGLITTASRCETDNFVSSGLSYEGDVAAVEAVPLTTTGCAGVAFGPTLLQEFSSTAAGTKSDALATLTVPEGHSTVRNIRVLEPQTFGPNYPAFGQAADMCPGSAADETIAFDSSECPPQAVVGTMTLNTPLLNRPLVGTVYLINKQPLPWFGVKIEEAGINVTLTGFTDIVKVDPLCSEQNPNGSIGFCQKQISVSFLEVPDVPISSVEFSLQNGPREGVAGTLQGNLLSVAQTGDSGCKTNDLAKGTVDGHTGASVQLQQNVTFTGC
ncbi:MAG: hypothetical protein JHD02_03270 [Thermoleophilaceae bacterium]|nr:hypothetical protein [Thermoleophilaceae bacterium]